MSKFHSHYDNLKITPDAPVELIRAAYRCLSQKYHPDRNPENPEAARVMSIINMSYAVLSDPIKRETHDDMMRSNARRTLVRQSEPAQIYRTRSDVQNWAFARDLGDQDAKRDATAAQYEGNPDNLAQPMFRRRRYKSSRNRILTFKGSKTYRLRILSGLALLIGALWVAYTTQHGTAFQAHEIFPSTEMPSAASATNVAPTWETPAPKQSAKLESSPINNETGAPLPLMLSRFIKPQDDPYGIAWPKKAGYIGGDRNQGPNGQAKVLVDNTQNSADVQVKINALLDGKTYTVRILFIPAHEKFVAESLGPGTYDVRFRDLKDGYVARSEQFELNEKSSATGHPEFTLAINRQRDRNPHAFAISDEEF